MNSRQNFPHYPPAVNTMNYSILDLNQQKVVEKWKYFNQGNSFFLAHLSEPNSDRNLHQPSPQEELPGQLEAIARLPEDGFSWSLQTAVLLVVYSIILFLSLTGNFLVIVTLLRNRRMRTTTNILLLNLSISDILLAVFCVPFTLTGFILRDFIFGSWACKVIPYLQGELTPFKVLFVLI